MTLHSRYDEPNGQIIVVNRQEQHHDIFRFDVEKKPGMRVVMDGSHHYEGPERTTTDRGRFVGARVVLRRVVRISQETGEPLNVTRHIPHIVASHLIENGAEDVKA